MLGPSYSRRSLSTTTRLLFLLFRTPTRFGVVADDDDDDDDDDDAADVSRLSQDRRSRRFSSKSGPQK